MKRDTTLEQVLSALEDLNYTQRYRDYVIDPAHLPQALPEGYALKFEERYLDPDAFHAVNPIPEFMASAMFTLGAALLDYLYVRQADAKMPHIVTYDTMASRFEALRERGVDVWKSEHKPEYDSECVCVRTRHGVFFAPLAALEEWVNLINSSHQTLALSATP